MKQFDIICVLGYAFDDEGNLPEHVFPRLKKVAQLYFANITPVIALAGKWNPPKDRLPLKPEETEAQKMKKMLVRLGVPENKIIKEEESQDTIGNAYFLKEKVVMPHHFKNILVVCADYHLKRVRYIFTKVFGTRYDLTFLPTKTQRMMDEVFMQQQEEIFKNQKDKLKHMHEGDHRYLEDQF